MPAQNRKNSKGEILPDGRIVTSMIKTLDELNAVKAKAAEVVSTRVEHKDSGVRDVLVCGGTGCTSSGSANIIKALEEEIEKNGLK